MMAKMLVNGELREKPTNSSGVYQRQLSPFRNWVSKDGSSGFKAEPNRYYLYVSKACPWCHRTTIMRSLKGLESVIPVVNVEVKMTTDGWAIDQMDVSRFPQLVQDQYLYEVYLRSDRNYSGPISAPVLWDTKTNSIVSNESSDIMRMFNTEFADVSAAIQVKNKSTTTDFYPTRLHREIDEMNVFIYENIGNAIYQVGFAGTQHAYDNAVTRLFLSFDQLERMLEGKKYLLGEEPTESDWRLFPSLIRFDLVYYTHFKANLRLLSDYPNLNNYTNRLYQSPGIADTVDFTHIKQHYYLSHPQLNPGGIVPIGPELSFAG
jgi:putative glutathione S-transferase